MLTNSYTWGEEEREIHMYHLVSFSPASIQTIETDNQRDVQGWESESQTGHELSLSGILTYLLNLTTQQICVLPFLCSCPLCSSPWV